MNTDYYAEVEEMVARLRAAMLNADGTALAALTSDSLSYGHSGGKIQNKAQFIESFASGASVFVTIQLSDQTIDVVNDTAVVRHILSAGTNDRGKGPAQIRLSILLVWIKTNNQWKLLTRQAVKAA